MTLLRYFLLNFDAFGVRGCGKKMQKQVFAHSSLALFYYICGTPEPGWWNGRHWGLKIP